jgi:hypothetical protein
MNHAIESNAGGGSGILRLSVGTASPIRVDVPTYVWQGGGGHMLIMPMDRPTGEELRAVKKGDSEFALAEFGPVGMLLFRFGNGIPWGDAVFNVVEAGRTRPETLDGIRGFAFEPGHKSTMTVVLTDPRKHIIQAVRWCSLSPEFSEVFIDLLKRQVQVGPIPDSEFMQRAQAIYAAYPTTSILPRVIARTIGGA